MDTRNLLCLLLIFVAASAQAASVDTSCAPQAVAAMEKEASQGDSRAQYWLGTQLEIGACGARNPKRAKLLIQQSAANEFPPAVHVLGVMLRRDGKYADSLTYFEKSAELGYPAGFADMGFTYGVLRSPVGDAVLSYAWLTVAISRESNAEIQEYLERTLAEVARTMSKDDLVKARGVATELVTRFASVPIWSDTR